MGQDTDDADAIDGELASLELERQRLELERERLDLERQRLELESAHDSDDGEADSGWQPAPAPLEDRRRRRAAKSGPNMAMLSAFGGVLAFASIGALLYAFGDRNKLTFLPQENDLTGETAGATPQSPVGVVEPSEINDREAAAKAKAARRAAEIARRKREREEREAAANRAIDAVTGGGEDAGGGEDHGGNDAALTPTGSDQDREALIDRWRSGILGLATEDDPRAALGRLAALRRSVGELPTDLQEAESQCRERLKQRREAQAQARETAAGEAAQRHGAQVAPFVDASLAWLWRHQHPKGYWDSDGWMAQCRVLPACRGPGSSKGHHQYDVGLTALALMAFAREDLSKQASPYRDAATRAATWLRAQQADDGSIGFGPGEMVYNHALATLALCTLLKNGDADRQLAAGRETCTKATRFVLQAQNPGLGWKYGVRSGRSDTSVTGWMVQALLAAREAGIVVDDAALVGAVRWFERASDTTGIAGYESPGGGSAFMPKNEGRFVPFPVMTAVAVASRGRLEPASARPRSWSHALESVLEVAPQWGPRTISFYYWYYGTVAAEAGSSGQFQRWRGELHAAVLPNQRLRGCADGSWDPEGEWCLAGGRVFATAMGALMLQRSDVQRAPRGVAKLKIGGQGWKPPAARPKAGRPGAAPAPKRPVGDGVVVASKLGGPAHKSFVVRGRLKNTDGIRRRGIRVHVKLRLGNGELAAEVDAEAPETLAPGQIAKFRAEYKGPGAKVIQTFDVEVAFDGQGEAPAAGNAPGAVPAAPPDPAASAKKRAYETTQAEKKVRARFAAMLKARQPGELRCNSCNGTRRKRCDPCNGSGTKMVTTGGSSYRRTCPGCSGSGSKECVTGSCIQGSSSLALKRAFSEFLSPATRAEYRKPAIYIEILRRSIAFSVLGAELEIAVARDISVEVFPNRVTVSATVLWSPGDEEEPWSVDWIRVKGRYYVATRYDTSREPILSD